MPFKIPLLFFPLQDRPTDHEIHHHSEEVTPKKTTNDQMILSAGFSSMETAKANNTGPNDKVKSPPEPSTSLREGQR